MRDTVHEGYKLCKRRTKVGTLNCLLLLDCIRPWCPAEPSDVIYLYDIHPFSFLFCACNGVRTPACLITWEDQPCSCRLPRSSILCCACSGVGEICRWLSECLLGGLLPSLSPRTPCSWLLGLSGEKAFNLGFLRCFCSWYKKLKMSSHLQMNRSLPLKEHPCSSGSGGQPTGAFLRTPFLSCLNNTHIFFSSNYVG